MCGGDRNPMESGEGLVLWLSFWALWLSFLGLSWLLGLFVALVPQELLDGVGNSQPRNPRILEVGKDLQDPNPTIPDFHLAPSATPLTHPVLVGTPNLPGQQLPHSTSFSLLAFRLESHFPAVLMPVLCLAVRKPRYVRRERSLGPSGLAPADSRVSNV